jgi:AraC-like DNA-binding protein
MSVEEIISCVGYENESFFRALFKKKYGVTPYQYKKQMKRGKI